MAGRSELSPQMGPQLRGAAKPRLYALFLPSALLTCMGYDGVLVEELALLRKMRRQSFYYPKMQSRCADACLTDIACNALRLRHSQREAFAQKDWFSVTPSLRWRFSAVGISRQSQDHDDGKEVRKSNRRRPALGRLPHLCCPRQTLIAWV